MMKAHELFAFLLLATLQLQNVLTDDELTKRQHDFLGKRNEISHLSKRSAELDGSHTINKRGTREFLGKGTILDNDDFNERRQLYKRRRDFLGKRVADDFDSYEDFEATKRTRDFLGKRTRDFLGKRARDFLGKRAHNLFGKRITFAQDCITDNQCGGDQCCVLTAFGIRKCRGLQDYGEKCHPNSMKAPSDTRRSFSLCPCMSHQYCSKTKYICV